MGMPLVVPECLPEHHLEVHPVTQSTDETGFALMALLLVLVRLRQSLADVRPRDLEISGVAFCVLLITRRDGN